MRTNAFSLSQLKGHLAKRPGLQIGVREITIKGERDGKKMMRVTLTGAHSIQYAPKNQQVHHEAPDSTRENINTLVVISLVSDSAVGIPKLQATHTIAIFHFAKLKARLVRYRVRIFNYLPWSTWITIIATYWYLPCMWTAGGKNKNNHLSKHTKTRNIRKLRHTKTHPIPQAPIQEPSRKLNSPDTIPTTSAPTPHRGPTSGDSACGLPTSASTLNSRFRRSMIISKCSSPMPSMTWSSMQVSSTHVDACVFTHVHFGLHAFPLLSGGWIFFKQKEKPGGNMSF